MKKETTLNTFQMLDKLRLECDELIQIAKSIIQSDSDEIKQAWRHLQLAKAWMGKTKGILGDPSPYTPAETVATIPPTNAVANIQLTTPSGDHLADVNYLRGKIDALINKQVKRYDNGDLFPSKDNRISLYQVITSTVQIWVHLNNASIFLGLELGRIREVG